MTRHSQKPQRHRDLYRLDPAQFFLPGLLVLALLSLAAWGGYELGLRDVGEKQHRFLGTLEAMFDSERRALDAEKQSTGEHLNAIALKVGEMQAQMLRLEAMGQRLVEMGDLDAGEFDFTSVPAMGGPESLADLTANLPDMAAEFRDLGKRIEDREAKLDLLEGLLMARAVREQAKPVTVPVAKGWVSSHYGWRTDPITGKKNLHKGVDYAGKYGSDILAAADGVVSYAGGKTGFGRTVEIRHGQGYLTRYAHNSKLYVKVGDLVKQGQVIAAMGHTGRATGTHLHFEVIRNERTVDPLKYVKSPAKSKPDEG